MRFVARLALAASLLGALARPGTAQQIRTGITSDTVTVGDVFGVALRLYIPPGFRAILPDSLPVSGELENAGRRFETDSLTGPYRELSALYPMTAWRPGEHELPQLEIQFEGRFDTRTVVATFPAVVVRSVLPPDTAGVQPRPPRDVLGPERLLWPWLLAALLAAFTLLGIGACLTARRSTAAAPAAAAPPLTPRQRALSKLEHARASDWLATGRTKDFYSAVAGAVRDYLAELDPAWSTDLTSWELIWRFETDAGPAPTAGLRRLLDNADMVKFAGRRPPPAEAMRDLEAARAFILEYERTPPPEPSPEPATAMSGST